MVNGVLPRQEPTEKQRWNPIEDEEWKDCLRAAEERGIGWDGKKEEFVSRQ
jgi:hypothetical protein